MFYLLIKNWICNILNKQSRIINYMITLFLSNYSFRCCLENLPLFFWNNSKILSRRTNERLEKVFIHQIVLKTNDIVCKPKKLILIYLLSLHEIQKKWVTILGKKTSFLGFEKPKRVSFRISIKPKKNVRSTVSKQYLIVLVPN